MTSPNGPSLADLEPRSITERWADQDAHGWRVTRAPKAMSDREAMGEHLAEMAKPGFPDDEDDDGSGASAV